MEERIAASPRNPRACVGKICRSLHFPRRRIKPMVPHPFCRPRGSCDCGRRSFDETQLMECHNGIVSDELTTIAHTDRISALILSDPISKIRKTLRNLPEISTTTSPDLNVVTVVDRLNRSYQVFLIGHELKVHIHDSRTRRWRSFDVGTLQWSAGKVDDVIGFENTVVAVKKKILTTAPILPHSTF